MRFKSFLILSFNITLLLACTFISDKSDNGDKLNIQEQIEATSNAQPTASIALTASATPQTDIPTPTDTPAPTFTLVPALTPTINPITYGTSSGDCKNETGSIKFINETGMNATIEMVMTRSGRTCAYFFFLGPGFSYWWIETPKPYQITITKCDGQIYTFTSSVSSNWYFTLKESSCESD